MDRTWTGTETGTVFFLFFISWGVLRGWVFGKTRGTHAVVVDKHYLYILFGLACWIVLLGGWDRCFNSYFSYGVFWYLFIISIIILIRILDSHG